VNHPASSGSEAGWVASNCYPPGIFWDSSILVGLSRYKQPVAWQASENVNQEVQKLVHLHFTSVFSQQQVQSFNRKWSPNYFFPNVNTSRTIKHFKASVEYSQPTRVIDEIKYIMT